MMYIPDVYTCSIYMCTLHIPHEIRPPESEARVPNERRSAHSHSLSRSDAHTHKRSVRFPNPFTCTRWGHKSIAHLFTHAHTHTRHLPSVLCATRFTAAATARECIAHTHTRSPIRSHERRTHANYPLRSQRRGKSVRCHTSYQTDACVCSRCLSCKSCTVCLDRFDLGFNI